MTNAAVAEAPASSAASQDAKPAPESQAPASIKDGAAPAANAGTDGGKPTQATSQTADTDAQEGKPADVVTTPDAPAKDTRSEAEIRADERNRLANEAAETTRQADLKRTQDELREIRKSGGKLARGLISKIEDHFDIRIPAEMKDELENFVETLNGKAGEAAKLELGDQAGSHQQAFDRDFVQWCLASVDPAKKDAYYAAMRGKGHDAWINGIPQYTKQPDGSVTVPSLIEEANTWGTDAATGLNDTEQAQLSKDLKGLKTAKSVIAAVAKVAQAKEARLPGPAPTGAERGYTASLDYAGFMRLSEPEKRAFNAKNPEAVKAFLGIK